MITTTLAAVALSGLLTPGANSALPAWQFDYGKAMAAAAAQQKPVAVFIGQGEAGYAGLVTDGQLPAKAGEVLSSKFVCVYVDTDTKGGKALADSFGLSKGLVISDKGGTVQALRHTGPVTPLELTGYVTKYSNATHQVVSTEVGGVVPAAATAPVAAPATAPATVGAPYTIAPAYFGGTCAGGNCGGGFVQPAAYPFVGGGCPGGRCGR